MTVVRMLYIFVNERQLVYTCTGLLCHYIYMLKFDKLCINGHVGYVIHSIIQDCLNQLIKKFHCQVHPRSLTIMTKPIIKTMERKCHFVTVD